MRFIFKIVLFFQVATSAIAQTNYPPNTVPWNNHPTNWVYDCNFPGYNNTSPDPTPLPCGYFDEPLITNTPVGFPSINPNALQLYLLGAPVLGMSGAQHTYSVTLQLENCVVGSNYDCYVTQSLNPPSWSHLGLGGTTATSRTQLITFSFIGFPPPMMFFRCHGLQAPPIPPVYVVTRTVPVGHEPYLLFACGVFTSSCFFWLSRNFW
jgi:hypothetical protein